MESAEQVAIWEEEVIIPTYPTGKPDRNPLFLEKRVYQGSSGDVYPYAVIDTLSDERVERAYRAVFLENEYLKIMILPELGGRIQMAYAKWLDYHFVYYNRVIKPALVGLAGPWIAGGIEFNWPQHHRPSTFSPVTYTVEKSADGHATVWLGEIDRMRRTKSVCGISLYPGKAYLRVEGRLFNRTSLPESFLWWANPSVHANEHYQSVFPPDVEAVYDHGKRDVSAFPIATGTYYKVDYSSGVDISWYKNLPVPTSYMAYRSAYDFLGGYDHGREAGILHIADHHLSPGKKLWTWGSSTFASAWERNLTDADGPYIELMTGVFTENQPDFTWMASGEGKQFEQYFMPYVGIGVVKNASKDVAINLERTQDGVRIGLYSTSLKRWQVKLLARSPQVRLLYEETVEVGPKNHYLRDVPLATDLPPGTLDLAVEEEGGGVRLAYRTMERGGQQVPERAHSPLPPAEVETTEELYLIGLHLEQYRHATSRSEDYYREALSRDPLDARANRALGLLLLRRGEAAECEPYFLRAIQRLTLLNGNPEDGSDYFYLGRAFELQGRFDDSYNAYYKAAWCSALAGASYLALARLATRNLDFTASLAFAEEAIAANPTDVRAWGVKAMAQRSLGRYSEALEAAGEALERDPLDAAAHFERWLTCAALEGSGAPIGPGATDALNHFTSIMGAEPRPFIELALDYAACGRYETAGAVLAWFAGHHSDRLEPLICYFHALFAEREGQRAGALSLLWTASHLPIGTCFPNEVEAIEALTLAERLDPKAARPSYFLGNLWYHNRCYEKAVDCWDRAARLDPTFPTTHRNLAFAAFNKAHDPSRARFEMRLAFDLDPTDARVLYELDQLERLLGASPEERLSRLERHGTIVARRDDLRLERCVLLNLLGRHAPALDGLLGPRFHPWEGGEGKAISEYRSALLGLAKEHIRSGNSREAASLAERALIIPDSLGEGRLPGALDSDVYYYRGRFLEIAGLRNEASASFSLAAAGEIETVISRYYNDQPADLLFYQGLALARLGATEPARSTFRRLADYGATHRDEDVPTDFFAVSLPDFLLFDDDPRRLNRIFCTYLAALGELGMAALGSGTFKGAENLLSEVVAEEPSHGQARELLRDLAKGWQFL